MTKNYGGHNIFFGELCCQKHQKFEKNKRSELKFPGKWKKHKRDMLNVGG